MAKLINLTGQRFGRLTVISEYEKRGAQMHWLCECDCGMETVVSGGNLRTGNTQSCGCIRAEVLRVHPDFGAPTIHGGAGTRLYNTWHGMNRRCTDAKQRSFKWYGARGIKVCDEWANSFPAFREWALASGYSETLTIDRIDTNGMYEPGNCKWSTMKEQNNNRRNNRDKTSA